MLTTTFKLVSRDVRRRIQPRRDFCAERSSAARSAAELGLGTLRRAAPACFLARLLTCLLLSTFALPMQAAEESALRVRHGADEQGSLARAEQRKLRRQLAETYGQKDACPWHKDLDGDGKLSADEKLCGDAAEYLKRKRAWKHESRFAAKLADYAAELRQRCAALRDSAPAAFTAIDTNGDGRLAPRELVAYRPAKRIPAKGQNASRRSPATATAVQADPQKLQAKYPALFAAADTDDNGRLNAQETAALRALVKAQVTQRTRPRPRPRPRQGQGQGRTKK